MNDEPKHQAHPDGPEKPTSAVGMDAALGPGWLLESILSASPEEMYVLDREGRFVFINRPDAPALGREPNEILGKTGLEIGVPAEVVAQFDQERAVVFSTRTPLAGSVVYPTPQGSRYYEYIWTPLLTGAEEISALLFAAHDVTERKREEQAVVETLNMRLQRSMRETHHRVKNNLQVVSALLDMQEMQYEETVPVSEIARLRQHIQALSTIYDLLTQQARSDSDVNDLSVQEAMKKLVPTIQSLVAGRKIDFAIEDLRMPVRHVTTLTVLVNELVSNAIKHGKGEISLAFSLRDGRAVLEVMDRGPGFPVSFDAATAANTGLELVQALTRLDLQGETRFENRAGGGGQAVVEFPIPSRLRMGGEE